MNPDETRYVISAHPIRHQQQRLPTTSNACLNFARAEYCLDFLALFRRKDELLRPRARMRPVYPRCRIDHAIATI